MDSLLLPAGGGKLFPARSQWMPESLPGLLELLPVATYACDAEGYLLWFNRRAEGLWGRAPRTGKTGELFCGAHGLRIQGRVVDRQESPMARALASGKAVEGVEAVVERPDGVRRRVTAHATPVFNADGDVIGAIGCFAERNDDDGADRPALPAMIDSPEGLRGVLDVLPAAVYTTDADGRITYYNQAAVELAGRVPQLGSDHWCVSWRLYRPDGTPLPHDQCPMAVALREGRPVRNMEIVAERPDGARVPVIPYPTPLRDDSGRIVGAVNMLVDISEREHAEGRQRVLIDELNHRIKNNMQMLHSLLAVARSEAVRDDAGTILANASQRVAAMAAAQRVLYGSRDPTRFDAKDFLEAVCRTAQQAFKTAHVECRAAEAWLSNDAAMPLALILNELLTNAVKYGIGGRGAGTIRVTLTRDDAGYELIVEDDGPGFDLAEARDRSSGLGLVGGLARQLGGRFRVERVPGARCSVRFPG